MLAWQSIKQVKKDFLRSKRSENYAHIVHEIAYQKSGCPISLKIHFPHSHLNFFDDNLEDVNNERYEMFLQDISEIETRYLGKPNKQMMGTTAGTCLEKVMPHIDAERKA